jgi:hypothetical protein
VQLLLEQELEQVRQVMLLGLLPEMQQVMQQVMLLGSQQERELQPPLD